MKTKHDPRHKQRQKIVTLLFTRSFIQKSPRNEVVKEILTHIDTIDQHIAKMAPSFPIDKINKIDLAILRLATYELLLAKKQPPKVVVDEAVELAKEYGGESSPAFVNGALGNLLKSKYS